MEFEQWERTYEEILAHFDYSREKDRESAELLSEVRGTDGLMPLRNLKGRVVEISGPYYTGKEEVLTISAGSTIEILDELGIEPNLMVTDLDGDTGLQLDKNLEGVPAAIHAHGDNMELIEKWADKFEGHVISTCQCKPPAKNIHNFGGFTDGDRAIYVADHFGAEKIILNGWDFTRAYSGGREKLKKLKWAKKLIERIDTPVEYV